MSLMIKGMDMPKDCWTCPLIQTDNILNRNYCGKTLKDIKDSFKRLDNCPLVEVPMPHGRLIDADKFLDWIHEFYPQQTGIMSGIKNARTIIEAEE